jgi:hypothetical protein
VFKVVNCFVISCLIVRIFRASFCYTPVHLRWIVVVDVVYGAVILEGKKTTGVCVLCVSVCVVCVCEYVCVVCVCECVYVVCECVSECVLCM